MTVAALQLPKRRRHDAANHFAESHVARMEPTDAVAFADVVDSDRWLHSLNDIGECIFKSPEDIHGNHEQYQSNGGRNRQVQPVKRLPGERRAKSFDDAG